MAEFGLRDRLIVALDPGKHAANAGREEHFRIGDRDVAELFATADLLINFNYRLRHHVVSKFRRTALIDIDPGLLQMWIGQGKISPARHDAHFTIGEAVARSQLAAGAIEWIEIRPAVCLAAWPYTYRPQAAAVTTVSSWWVEGHVQTEDGYLDNSKARLLSELRRTSVAHRPDAGARAVSRRRRRA